MDWFDYFYTALLAIIVGAWPDVDPAAIYQDTQIERVDWTQAQNNQEFTPPWVAVKCEIAPTDEWGMGPKQLLTVTIWYIDTLEGAELSGPTAQSGIAAKLLALQAALYASQTLGTTLDGITMDVTSENPVNMSFLGAKVPFQAGSLTCQIVVVSG